MIENVWLVVSNLAQSPLFWTPVLTAVIVWTVLWIKDGV